MLTIWPTDMGSRGSTAFRPMLEKVSVNVLMGFIKLKWQIARLGSDGWSQVGFFTEGFQSKWVCKRTWHSHSHTLTQRWTGGERVCVCVYLYVCVRTGGWRGSLVNTLPEKESLVQASERRQRQCCFCFWKAMRPYATTAVLVLGRKKKLNLRGYTLLRTLLCSKDHWNASVDIAFRG